MDGMVKLFSPKQQFYASWESEPLKAIARVGSGSRQAAHTRAPLV
jgi:hypothetical protein